MATPKHKSTPKGVRLPKPPPRKPRRRRPIVGKKIELTATKEAVQEQLRYAIYALINQAHRGENADNEKMQSAIKFLKSWLSNHTLHMIRAAVEIEQAESEIQQLEMDMDYDEEWDDAGGGADDRDSEYQIQNLEEEIAYSEDDYWNAVDSALEDLREVGLEFDIPKHRD